MKVQLPVVDFPPALAFDEGYFLFFSSFILEIARMERVVDCIDFPLCFISALRKGNLIRNTDLVSSDVKGNSHG